MTERAYTPEITTSFTVHDLLRRRAELQPDRIALNVDDGPTIGYGEWDRRSNAVARGLIDAGVRHGQVIGLVFDGLDWIDYAVAYMGVLKAGATATHLNQNVGADEIVRRMEFCSAVGLLHGEDVRPPAAFTGFTGTVTSMASQDTSDPQIGVDVTDISDILFTSGTTGPAKGSASPHGNLTYGRGPEGFHLFGDPEPLLTPMPLGTTASATTINFSIHTPSTLVICPIDAPERMAQLIEKFSIGSIMITPWLAMQLVHSGATERHDLSCVETIANASTALPPAIARRLLEAMPNARLNMSYAASEAVPASIGHTFDPAVPMATGRPLRGTELRIADEHGEEAPTGELGEIWLRSPAPKRYYFDNPELNAKVHADRWTRTGDLGRVDADGLLHFFDRRNVAIRTRGTLVSTIEVEAALYEHPAVRAAAVFGMPGADGDQEVTAAVALADPAALDELPGFLAGHLAPEQIPGRIHQVDVMPRSANGKVLKHVLRDRLTGRAG
ncbi:class I adenylate-forming enzyme family protein [Streptomyces sp. JL1001]|uniref:Class I adenylate-forming enzyme family protein n=1 Tax=Streptomyces sp. JL1001 TaxID=3078227 RepID=A0AAU8K900_9ACTN|nr:class I adenylate-forming enzyme family protein [Streptomyces sp. CB02613]PJN27254.1 AMP-dependent synthetase [Streptomyces sp. CB02613]